jgi:hypothetical protein
LDDAIVQGPMNLTRIRTILATALVGALAGAAVVDLATGVLFDSVEVPWAVSVLLVSLAAGILVAAWPVRQYVVGKRRRIDPLRAATVLALAKSCTLAGAALGGAYLGVALIVAGELHSPLAWGRLWQDVAAAAAAVLLSVAGRVAEWLCRLPPTESEPKRQIRQAGPSPA